MGEMATTSRRTQRMSANQGAFPFSPSSSSRINQISVASPELKEHYRLYQEKEKENLTLENIIKLMKDKQTPVLKSFKNLYKTTEGQYLSNYIQEHPDIFVSKPESFWQRYFSKMEEYKIQLLYFIIKAQDLKRYNKIILTVVILLFVYVVNIISMIENHGENLYNQSDNTEYLCIPMEKYNIIKEDVYQKYTNYNSNSIEGKQYAYVDKYYDLIIVGLYRYFNYRERLNKQNAITQQILYPRMTVQQWLHFIGSLKNEWVKLLGIQFNVNNPEESLSSALLDSYAIMMTNISNIPDGSPEMSFNFRDTMSYVYYFVMIPPVIKKTDKQIYPGLWTRGCKEHFKPLKNTPYKALKDRFVNACSILNGANTELKDFRNTIHCVLKQVYPYYQPTSSILDYTNGFIIQIYDINRSFVILHFYTAFLDFIKPYNYTNIDYTKRISFAPNFWFKYFDAKFINEEGYFIGVQQDLIQSSLTQLKDWGVFVPTEEGSERYMLNIDWKLTHEQMQHYSKINPDVITNIFDPETFYLFVGGLIGRAMLMGIYMPFSLSFYTLGLFYNFNKQDPFFNMLYYFLDFPEESKSRLEIMSYDEETIGSLDMNYNDIYPIIDETKPNAPISTNNILEYMELYSDFYLNAGVYISKDKPLKVVQSQEKKHLKELRNFYVSQRKKYRSCLKQLINGFYIRAQGFFIDELYSVHVLDKMMYNGVLNEDALEDLKKQIQIVYPEIYDHFPDDLKGYYMYLRTFQKDIAEMFVEELLNPLVKIPYERTQEFKDSREYPKTDDEKKDFYFKSFMPRLLTFWNSTVSIQNDKIYRIQMIVNDPRSTPMTLNSFKNALGKLPISHTCFTTLDIPTFNIPKDLNKDNVFRQEIFDNKTEDKQMDAANTFVLTNCLTADGFVETLIEKLVIAVYSNVGFGLAGGRGRGRGRQRVNKK
jgi:hypothetical protein